MGQTGFDVTSGRLQNQCFIPESLMQHRRPSLFTKFVVLQCLQ